MKSENANQAVSVEFPSAMIIIKSEKKSKNDDSSMNKASRTGSRHKFTFFLPALLLYDSFKASAFSIFDKESSFCVASLASNPCCISPPTTLTPAFLPFFSS